MTLRARTTCLLAIAALLTCAAVAAPVRASDYSFAVIGDTQPAVGDLDLLRANRYYLAAAAQMAAVRRNPGTNTLDPASFTVHLGDFINGITIAHDQALWQQQLAHARWVENFTPPAYHVAGNHEVQYGRAYEADWYEAEVAPLWYSWRVGPDLFIVLCSEVPGETNQIAGRQLVWLSQTLRQQHRWTFVFIHSPLWAAEMGALRFASNWMQQVHPLLAQRRVTAVFAGHIHAFLDFGEIDGVRYIVSGGGGGTLDPRRVGIFHDLYPDQPAEASYHWLRVTVTASEPAIELIPIPEMPQ